MGIDIFCTRLKTAMKARGYTAETLAGALSVNPRRIEAYLKGERLPRVSFAVEMARVLNVRLNYLVGRSEGIE